ncbi:MAG: IclR family transcriptional regulator [Alphaproteobacteria bacterium]|nr:IclR family transcriptional regulator [Alphaproteobacteria bacterium]
MAGQTPGERGSALSKAVDVLRLVAESERAVGLAELAEQLELPRPTLHRVLQQLVEEQLILRAAPKDRYVVGPKLTQLSGNALRSLSAQPPVRAILNELVAESQETCNVGVLDQDEVVYIERVEGISPLRLQLQIGSRVPFHCTAIGKLLAAEQHKNVRTRLLRATELERFTEHTLSSETALEEEFSTIRSEGFSFNNEEFVEGLSAIAVAINDGAGRPVAALSIHALHVRMPKDKAMSYLTSMRDKADRIAEAWSL